MDATWTQSICSQEGIVQESIGEVSWKCHLGSQLEEWAKDGIQIAQDGREFQVKVGTAHLLLLSLLSPTLLLTFDSWPASQGNVRE